MTTISTTKRKGRGGDAITAIICAGLILGGMFTASHAVPTTAQAPVRDAATVNTFSISGGSLASEGGEIPAPARD